MTIRSAAIPFIPFLTALSLHSTLGAQASRSVWDGVYTQEQADRGKTVYMDACASCHGPELAGADTAPSLVNNDFATDWDGLSVGDLFNRIAKSMPQDKPGTLNAQQYADVVAFILNGNKFPVGATELPKETETLKMIKYESKKVGD